MAAADGSHPVVRSGRDRHRHPRDRRAVFEASSTSRRGSGSAGGSPPRGCLRRDRLAARPADRRADRRLDADVAARARPGRSVARKLRAGASVHDLDDPASPERQHARLAVRELAVDRGRDHRQFPHRLLRRRVPRVPAALLPHRCDQAHPRGAAQPVGAGDGRVRARAATVAEGRAHRHARHRHHDRRRSVAARRAIMARAGDPCRILRVHPVRRPDPGGGAGHPHRAGAEPRARAVDDADVRLRPTRRSLSDPACHPAICGRRPRGRAALLPACVRRLVRRDRHPVRGAAHGGRLRAREAPLRHRGARHADSDPGRGKGLHPC